MGLLLPGIRIRPLKLPKQVGIIMEEKIISFWEDGNTRTNIFQCENLMHTTQKLTLAYSDQANRLKYYPLHLFVAIILELIGLIMDLIAYGSHKNQVVLLDCFN